MGGSVVSRPALPALAASALLLAGAAGCNLSRRSPDRDEIRFEHGVHLARGQGCVDCHEEATFAREELDAARERGAPASVLPNEASCRACHSEGAQARCEYCHTDPRHPQTYAPTRTDILFDHSEHEEALRGRCVRCHGPPGARDGALVGAFEPRLPEMDRCTDGCHEEEMAEMRCTACHTDLQRYDVDTVASLGHGPGWVSRHGPRAAADPVVCSTCHEPTFCEECHLSAQGAPLEAFAPMRAHRDFVHRGDFLARHGVEVRLERGTCARCHGVQFCDGCHQASGIGGGVAPGSPHPPGWLDPLSRRGHAVAARRDLLSCAACHDSDAEQVCVPCHRVGGVAASPHPPGFGSGMDENRHAVCRVCHVP